MIEPEASSSKSYQYALRLLCQKDYSRHKLKMKLKEKKYSDDDVEESLQLLIDQKYLREDLYIEARIKGFMNKNQSPSFIQRKLRQEKIEVTLDFIESIFTEYHLTISDQVTNLVRKKMPKHWPENQEESFKQEGKILRFLISKGHDYQEGKAAIKKVRQEDVSFF